jgi:Ca2+-transporting ATPase
VRGKGYVEISRTGEKSAMGRLAVMIGGIEAEKTPLERRLEKFGGQIARGVLALVILIAAGGLLVDGLERIGHVFLFAIALAVAAVPEGLPAVLTLTLALGVERMAKRKAVVRRLSAVEGNSNRHGQDRHADREPDVREGSGQPRCRTRFAGDDVGQ